MRYKDSGVPKIAVLMSTYNGEQFLEQQLDSILKQKNVNVKIYVRDDGSTDRTNAILKSYEEEGKLSIIQAKKNLGPGKSFMTLLYKVSKMKSYDFIAFADQDDIWLPEKLSKAVERLQEVDDIPALYGSNQIIFQDGKEEGLRFHEEIDTSLKYQIHRNLISGCTMIMNMKLAEEIVIHPCPPSCIIDYRIHDAWVALVATLRGEFIYDPDSYILYRIHENNTVGIKKTTLWERMDRLFKRGENHKKRANIRSNSAKVLLKYYPDMKKKDMEILRELAGYRRILTEKKKLLEDSELIMASGEPPVIFKLKVLMNFI